ncbi:MAG: hypothetical protein ACJAVS_002602 [Paracoccaceae bacterium]|jgi:hypothetical protein
MRQQSPAAARAQQIKDRLDDLALRRAAWAVAWRRVRHHWLITAHWPFVSSLGSARRLRRGIGNRLVDSGTARITTPMPWESAFSNMLLLS